MTKRTGAITASLIAALISTAVFFCRPGTASQVYASGRIATAIASEKLSENNVLLVLTHRDSPKGRSNAVVKVDPFSGNILSTITLPPGNPASFAMDDLGRFWIGYSYDNHRMDNRVNVISPEGKRHEMRAPCMNPERGFVFTAGKAGVVCSNRGLDGSLAIYDKKSLSLLDLASLEAPGGIYLITAASASSGMIAVAGMAKGPDPRKRYCVITLIDVTLRKKVWQSDPVEGLDVWKILPYGKHFILLNAASAETGSRSADMLLLGADHSIKHISTVSAPVWGVLRGHMVYAYHNASWNSQRSSGERFLSAYNLETGELKKWRIPDRWEASDLTFSHGRFYLTKGMEAEKSQQGVYAFNPKDHSLKLITKLPGARLLLEQ